MSKKYLSKRKRIGKYLYLFYPRLRSVIKYNYVNRTLIYCSPACELKFCINSFGSCFGCIYKID